MKRLLYLITLIMLLPLSLSAKKENTSGNSNALLSESMMYEALRCKQLGAYDAYFELVKSAYRTDTTNTVAGFYYAVALTKISADKSDLSYRLMKGFNREFPDEYYENTYFAQYCQSLGKYVDALEVWEHLISIYPEKIELQYNLAITYTYMQRYLDALDTYESIESAQGKSLETSIKKINIHLVNESDSTLKSENAIKEARSLLETAPQNAEYNVMMAQVYSHLNQQDSTLAYLNRAQQYDPDNGGIYFAKAEFYHNQGDSVMYDKMIYQALTRGNLNIETKLKVLSDYTSQLISENDSSQRVTNFFNLLIKQHPHQSEIHRLYSQYFVTMKDYDSAIEQLQYALDTDPGNSEDWEKIMFICLMSNKNEKATEAAEKSLEYNPDNIKLYQYIAPAYIQMGKYEKAIETYEKAFALADTTDINLVSSLWCGLGDAKVQHGDTTEGFECYEKALDLAPGNTMALNNYAYFLSLKGKNLDKAERLAALAVRADPENSSNLDTYAWIYFKKHEYQLALMYIERAFDVADAEMDLTAELYDHYGDILFMVGQPEKALENWKEALKLDPENKLIEKKVKFKTYFYE